MRKVLAAVMLMCLSACATIVPERPTALSPFGDGTQWVVLEDLDFIITMDNKSTAIIRVPKGFVTDLASTPKEIWSLYPPFGKYLTASILHDYLYWRGTCTQNQADKILYQTMHDAKVDQKAQSRFYVALEKFGGTAWSQNMIERKEGLVRVIPEKYLQKRTPITDWDTFRKSLKTQHVIEPEVASDKFIPSICSSLDKEIKVKSGFMNVVFGK